MQKIFSHVFKCFLNSVPPRVICSSRCHSIECLFLYRSDTTIELKCQHIKQICGLMPNEREKWRAQRTGINTSHFTKCQHNLLCRSPVLAMVKASIRLCIWVSQPDTVSKQHKLGSLNHHCQLSEDSSFRIHKGFPVAQKESHWSKALNKRGGWKNGNFQPISCCSSEMVQHRGNVTNSLLIPNRKSNKRTGK